MKVSIDDSLCTGCSLCVGDLPEVFEMGDDGLAKVIVAEPTGDLAERAQETAPTCPASAIIIED